MPNAPKLDAPQGWPLFEVQFRAVSEALAGNGVLTTDDLEVTATANALEAQVAAGTAYYQASEVSLNNAPQTFSLSGGDADHDRWDTVYFDTATGDAGVREGSAEQYPSPPDVQGDELLLAVIYVESGATDVSDAEVLNWRAKFSNEAEEVHYDDGEGIYGTSSVAGALDLLQQAAQIGSYPLAQDDLDTDSVGTDELISGAVGTDELASGAVTSSEVATGAVTSDGIADGTVADADIDSNTSIAREKLTDERATTGPHTSNITTSGEEVVLADTSGGGVTVTLASSDATTGNFVTVVDVGGAAGTNAISIETESGETIDGDSAKSIASDYSALVVNSDGSDWFTAAGSGERGGVDVTDDGTAVADGSTFFDFGANLTATSNGDGVTVDSETAGITVLAEGTFTHTGGSATSQTATGVTTDETANLYVEVGVDADPAFDADYAWSYNWSEAWDDANQQVDVTINAAWDTDPASGNDVVLDYRIYTLDVQVSKSRIQDLVDSPNGHVPTALLEADESAEISVPVPNGESLKVYRWGGYLIADGTAPSGLEVQLLDDADSVQASENTVNTESTGSPVAELDNASGDMSVYKLRINNGTGSDHATDGVGAMFSYVVE